MNEISETFLRDTEDGSMRWSSLSHFAKTYQNQGDAEEYIKTQKIKDAVVTPLLIHEKKEVRS
jgi:hypothetical protein